MPWVKPKARPENGDTINVSDLEILAPYHALLSGGADEHNFVTDGLTATSFPKESLVRVHTYNKSQAHDLEDGGSIPSSGLYGITPYRQWVPLVDNATGNEISITVTTGRCTAQCLFSALESFSSLTSSGYLQFAVEVDGVLDMNGATHNPDMNWSVQHRHAVACSAMFTLESGEHTFRVMAFALSYASFLSVRSLDFTVIERRA